MEKERLEREEQNQLTEEQREEIKEAVCFSSPPPFFSFPRRLHKGGMRAEEESGQGTEG